MFGFRKEGRGTKQRRWLLERPHAPDRADGLAQSQRLLTLATPALTTNGWPSRADRELPGGSWCLAGGPTSRAAIVASRSHSAAEPADP